jgi:hypothetical protein
MLIIIEPVLLTEDTLFLKKKTFKNPGGQANFRNLKTEKEDTAFLKKMFGDVVRKRPNIKKKKSTDEQRIVLLPF